MPAIELALFADADIRRLLEAGYPPIRLLDLAESTDLGIGR